MHMHTLKVLHRDIKPANILVNTKYQAKVCDLGLSKVNQMATVLSATVGTKHRCGSPMFMAPEVYFFKTSGTTYSDVWSLACSLNELHRQKNI